MKYLSLTFLTLMSVSSYSLATTIYEIQDDVALYANAVSNSSGNYFDQTFAGSFSTPISANALSSNLAGDDLTSYAWTPDYHMPTGPDNAYVDLQFGQDIYNGDGVDLVLFFAGNGTTFKNGDVEPFIFTLDVGADGSNEGGTFGVTTSTTSSIYSNQFFASYAQIDLDAFGFDQNTPLGDIRIYLGDKSMPALSALGAYHTTAVVPVPLSAVLFASGLALLSVFRRKKHI